MRRHTTKGVVSSKKLDDDLCEGSERKAQQKEDQSKKRKRIAENETESEVIDLKKQKLSTHSIMHKLEDID